jgi:prepilin-type N-terminal cleavage/methylation domain-containing protein
MKMVSSKKGFTLIELVLVMVILGIVGLAIYGTFANGLNIWKRITQQTQTEDINLFFEKITFDLRNSFKLAGVKFRGGRTEIRFPHRTKYVDDEKIKDSIGQVTYSFNSRKKTIDKSEASYSDIFYNREGTRRVLAEKIQSLRFAFFIFDPRDKQYAWVTSWQEKDQPLGIVIEENLPLIVRVELSVEDDGREIKYVRTIPLPSACCWPMESGID